MATIKIKTKKTVRHSNVEPDTIYEVKHRPYSTNQLKHEITTLDGVQIDVRDVYKKFGLSKPPKDHDPEWLELINSET